jgi:hypothetical protein
MFWLGHVTSQNDRLQLLGSYVGRPQVPQRDPLLVGAKLPNSLAKSLEASMRQVSSGRANAFRHYMTAMTYVFQNLSHILPNGAPAIFIVGHSTWNGTEIPTSALFQEIAGSAFTLDEYLSYPVKNRYMSYARHNDANIATEYVLVLRRSRSSTQA